MVFLSRSENSSFLIYCQKIIKQKVKSQMGVGGRAGGGGGGTNEPEKFVTPDAMEDGL